MKTRFGVRLMLASVIVASSAFVFAGTAHAAPSLNCAAGGRGGAGGDGGYSRGGNGGLAFSIGGLGGSGFADASGGDAGSARGGSGGRGGNGTLPICNQNTNGGYWDDWAPSYDDVVYYYDDWDW